MKCDANHYIITYFRELTGGRLFEEWALMPGGAYLIILCLGWALVREWALIRGGV